jgi:hypothetical protein
MLLTRRESESAEFSGAALLRSAGVRAAASRIPAALMAVTFVACGYTAGMESAPEAANEAPDTSPATRVWSLTDFTPAARWSDRELQTPLLLASPPERTPPVFLLPQIPEAGDQGRQANGAAWSAGYVAATYYQRSRKNRSGYVCSPAYVYNRLNQGENRGIEVIDALQLLQLTGCPDQKFMPYDPGDFVRQPTMEALQDAARHRIAGFARIDFLDPEQVKAHLLQGSVIIATLRVTSGFMTAKDPVWSGPVGQDWYLQSVAVVGYDDAQRYFLIQNSMGPAWARFGRIGVPYDWFVRLTERAYVLW